jgi:PPIC-type PPIASE domain
MRRSCFVRILLFFAALGCQSPAQQAAVNSPTASEEATSPGTQVAPDAAVITIDGVCKKAPSATQAETSKPATAAQPDVIPSFPDASAFGLPASAPASNDKCVTVITRAQFEKLANALSPKMSPNLKLQVATFYPQMLLSAQRIEELGLDKDQSFETKVGFGYAQVLHKAFTQYVQDQARDISDADVEKYYKDHPEAFEQVDLLRILIPTSKRDTSEPTHGATSAEPDMRLEAERIRREAVAGGDFQKLQEKAFKAAGDPSDPPDVEVGRVTRAEIPVAVQTVVFGLQPGQVSKPVQGSEGRFIFKVRSKSIIPLSNAKGVIQKIRTTEAIDALKNSIHAQLNESYFSKTGADAAKPDGGTSR